MGKLSASVARTKEGQIHASSRMLCVRRLCSAPLNHFKPDHSNPTEKSYEDKSTPLTTGRCRHAGMRLNTKCANRPDRDDGQQHESASGDYFALAGDDRPAERRHNSLQHSWGGPARTRDTAG